MSPLPLAGEGWGEGRMQCSCLSLSVILDIFNRGSRFLFIPSFVTQTLDSCFRK